MSLLGDAATFPNPLRISAIDSKSIDTQVALHQCLWIDAELSPAAIPHEFHEIHRDGAQAKVAKPPMQCKKVLFHRIDFGLRPEGGQFHGRIAQETD